MQEGAKVISMSLGGGYSDLYASMAASIQQAGALLVAAAGNGECCCRTLLLCLLAAGSCHCNRQGSLLPLLCLHLLSSVDRLLSPACSCPPP